MIDITMTAIVLRPEILIKTLYSIKDRIINPNGLRLVIDIAPAKGVKGAKASQLDILNIANTFFDDRYLIYRAQEESLQAEAIKWMWGKSDSEFVLHWEDDWVATKRIDLEIVKHYFEVYPALGMIYFDRLGKSVNNYPGYKDAFKRMSHSLWMRTKGKSLGGPPALLHRDYINEVIPLIKNTECLDITSRSKKAQELLKRWSIGVYTGEENEGNLVEDIGKKWRVDRGLKMVKKTPRGVTWIKN